MQNDKIIGVSHIVFNFQIAFEKVVELVHINIDEKLTGQIAER